MLNIAATIEAMKAKGMSDGDILTALACIQVEASPVVVVDEQAQRRRAADRARKASKRLRNSAESAESNPPSTPEGFPHTPFLNPSNPNPPSPPKGGSSPAENEFESVFWPAYPHKVGKPDARKKFTIARRKVSLDAIMAGLDAYRAKTDDRPWCNPATWLHQERWADQPANVVPIRGSPIVGRPKTAADFLLSETMDRIDASFRPETSDWADAGEFPGLTVAGSARRLGLPDGG